MFLSSYIYAIRLKALTVSYNIINTRSEDKCSEADHRGRKVSLDCTLEVWAYCMQHVLYRILSY